MATRAASGVIPSAMKGFSWNCRIGWATAQNRMPTPVPAANSIDTQEKKVNSGCSKSPPRRTFL